MSAELPLLKPLPEPVEAVTLRGLMAWAESHPAGTVRDAAEEIVLACWNYKRAGHRDVPANAVRAWSEVQLELLEGC